MIGIALAALSFLASIIHASSLLLDNVVALAIERDLEIDQAIDRESMEAKK